MRLCLQYSFPRPDVDEIFENIVIAVSTAGTQTGEIDLLIHHCRVVVLSQLE